MTIESLGKTYLDINGTVSEQQDTMSLIKDEVTQALIFSFLKITNPTPTCRSYQSTDTSLLEGTMKPICSSPSGSSPNNTGVIVTGS